MDVVRAKLAIIGHYLRIKLTVFVQDEYSILNSKHFIGIHGYLLVYSVASKQSFEMVRIIREKILGHLVSFFKGLQGAKLKRILGC